MNYFFDLIHLVFSKWKNSRKLVLLTILNLSVGLCILTVFINAGFNINQYTKDNFFTGERLRHILILPRENHFISTKSVFLKDPLIESSRLIYDSNVDVISVDGVDYSDSIHLDLTVMKSDDLLFKNEYASDDVLKRFSPEINWKKGIVLSEKSLALFEDKDPLGMIVKFKYNGHDYSLPITAIISSSAEENYNFEYKSFMYVFSDEIFSLTDSIEAADIRLESMESVKEYLDKHDSNEFKIVSNVYEINHVLGLSNTVVFLLILTGILFVIFSSIGIINCLTYMQDSNIKTNCLLKIIGFSKKDVLIMNFFESLLLGILGCTVSLFMFFIVTFIMMRTKIFQFEFISAKNLFNINSNVLIICLFISIVIVISCKLLAARKIKANNLLDLLKSER